MVDNLREAAEAVKWTCRFHPTDWWHEVGCPHMEWTKEQLLDALIDKKRFEDRRIAALVNSTQDRATPLDVGRELAEAVIKYSQCHVHIESLVEKAREVLTALPAPSKTYSDSDTGHYEMKQPAHFNEHGFRCFGSLVYCPKDFVAIIGPYIVEPTERKE